MYFSNHFHKAFVNLAGNLNTDTSKSSADLAPGQLAFVDAKTFDVLDVAAATVVTHPLVILAQGSLYQNDKLTDFHGGYAESVKSRPINGRYITKFTKHSPVAEKPHVVQIGYLGEGCVCPEFKKDESYDLRVELKGSPVLRAYTRNLYRVFTVHTGCLTDPSDPTELADPEVVFKAYAEQISNDPQLSDFLKRVMVVKEGQTSITGTAIYTWQASRCDSGTIADISAVIAAYPGAKLVSHTGSTSTYQLIQTATPSNNVNSTGLTWAKTETAYKAKKKICLTLPLKSTGASNLSDVQSFYSGDTKFVSGSIAGYNIALEGTTTTTTTTTSSTTSTTTTLAGDGFVGCTEVLQAEIYSDNNVDIMCEGVDVAVFTMPTSYNGYSWEECPCDTIDEDTDKCVGLRLVAKKSSEVTDKFSNCSFDAFDHIETEPITIIVSFVNKNGEVCEFTPMPIIELQTPVIAQGLGELALRELLQSSLYSQDFFLSDPRMREVIQYPYLDAIDRNKNYIVYVIAHTIPTGIGPSGSIGQDRFLYRIFMEESLTTNFETWMNAYLVTAGTGVALETL